MNAPLHIFSFPPNFFLLSNTDLATTVVSVWTTLLFIKTIPRFLLSAG